MKSKNCCKEKSITYKVKENQNNRSKIILFQNHLKTLDVYYSGPISFIKSGPNLDLISYSKPPGIDFSIIYLINNVFRI